MHQTIEQPDLSKKVDKEYNSPNFIPFHYVQQQKEFLQRKAMNPDIFLKDDDVASLFRTLRHFAEEVDRSSARRAVLHRADIPFGANSVYRGVTTMARMFPSQLDPATKSHAERVIYNAFRDQLDNTYVVFHNVAWLSLDRRKHPQDGEADFVLAHPDFGVLILEVKGGIINRDLGSKQWSSTDKAGNVHPIKNPLEQAKGNKYSLLDQLKPMLNRYVEMGHAVAFPEVTVGKRFLGLDLPRQIVLDQTDLPHLALWVQSTMDYWSNQFNNQKTSFGEDGIHALISILGKQWELHPALWGQFIAEHEQLIQLTKEQFYLLDVLNRHRRVIINGFAGSGKTLIAVEKATRLALQGFRVLLTCFNRQLATDIRMNLGLKSRVGQSLDVFNFHDLCTQLSKKAHIEMPESKYDAQFFEEFLPNTLLEVSKDPDYCYDAIIADEGQDFLDNWWFSLQCLLRDPDNGIFYVFYDDNQRLHDRKLSFPITQLPYQLIINCRTTRQIHTQILAFYHGDTSPVAPGPEGKPVEFLYYEERSQLQETLMTLLRRLTDDESIPAEEIVVLTPFSQRTSRIKPQKFSAETGLWWSPIGKHVELETIHSFKGLERAVIVLVEIDRWLTQGVKTIDLERLLYVGCSRARNYLIILLPKQVPEGVNRFFIEHAGPLKENG